MKRFFISIFHFLSFPSHFPVISPSFPRPGKCFFAYPSPQFPPTSVLFLQLSSSFRPSPPARPSPATFLVAIVAHHLRRTSSATFRGVSVARHLLLLSYYFPISLAEGATNLNFARYQNSEPRLPPPSPPSPPYPLCLQYEEFLSPVPSSGCTSPGNVSGRFRRPSPPASPLRRRFRAFPSPVTSARTSLATFPAVFVALHLRLYLPGDVSGRYRRPSPPAVPLWQRFWPLSSPITSAIPHR